MASYHYSPILFMLLALLTQLAESRLTQETLTTAFGATSKSSANEGTKWAVLVAGSMGFGNYRHQVSFTVFYHLVQIRTNKFK